MENIQTKAGRSRPEKKRLAVGFAHTQSDILEAQRLRYPWKTFLSQRWTTAPERRVAGASGCAGGIDCPGGQR